jgi:hypothetical protein
MLIIIFLLIKLMNILCFCGSASALASTTSGQAGKKRDSFKWKSKMRDMNCKYFGQRCVLSYSAILHLLQLLV